MEIQAYIGIAGVKSREESLAIQDIVRQIGLPSTHVVAVGVLVSYRSLAFGERTDPKQYAFADDLGALMLQDRQLMNIVHYNSRADGLPRQIRDVMRHIPYADGVQLNVPWPSAKQMVRLRWMTYAPVILQIGQDAYRQAGSDPKRLVERLRGYLIVPGESVVRPAVSMVDYVLIDPSGGLGRSFDPVFAADVLGALVESGLPIKWGIAGGLGPGKLDVLEPLLQIYPELSWDAQARLRTSDGQSLDLSACETYLKESIALIN